MTARLAGGSIRILWDADETAEVTITGGSFTIDGVTATFPHTLSETTTFDTTADGTYTVSVIQSGVEIAGTPDGTRQVVLRFGSEETFAPSLDKARPGGGVSSWNDLTDKPDLPAIVTDSLAARAFAPLKAALDQGNPRPVALQVFGDSTGNEDTEWPRLTLAALASRYPSVTFQEARWSPVTNTTLRPTVIQTGAAGEAYLNVVTGQTTPAIPQASAPAFPAVLDLRVRLAADDWTTSVGSGVIMGRENGAGQRSWWLSLAATGYPQLTLSSDGTALTTIHNGGFAVPFTDGAAGWLRVVYTCNDGAGNRVFKAYTSSDAITWTQLGTTTTTAGALTPFSPTNAPLTLGGRGGGSGMPGKIYAVEMLNGENGPDLVPRMPGSWPQTPTGTPMTVAGAPVCTLVNGSLSGANAAILSDSTTLAKMSPNFGQLVIIVSDSHNEGGLVDADFIATYSALVNGAKTRMPGVPVIVLTQNPENGAVNQVAHSARRWNLISYAAANGYALIDTYKAFTDDPGGVPALMTDTLHPNATGSALWADTVVTAFDNA